MANTRQSPSPVKRIVLISGIALVALVLFGFLFDVVGNLGRIHGGVTVQGIDIGGKTREEAAAILEEQLGASIASAPVDLFADEYLKSAGADDLILELTGASTSYNMSEGIEGSRSWRISTMTVGAAIDGASLAESAYAIGRGTDFLSNRLKANFFGIDLGASLNYEASQIATLESLIGSAIGSKEQNADISYSEGNFIVVPSQEGYGVAHDALVAALDRAFLSDERSFVVPMSTVPALISDQEAGVVAAFAQAAVQQPVALVYEGEDSWSLDTSTLASWITTSIEGKGDTTRLVAHIAKDRLEADIHAIIGDWDPGIRPQNARFEVVDDAITIIPSVDGTGIDYAQVATNLNLILFPKGEPTRDRRIALSVTTLAPALSTADAEAMHIGDKIARYTTEYTTASGAKVTNIHLAADLLNKSLIEPGGLWSFNDTAGECNAERGFQKAPAIVEGEYIDEIGGGICQVATTVFNAVFDSGLPIMERVNHGLYIAAYPAGRDAAVSWSWPDFKFENDTGNWMLLTMSYTDSTVTCTLWGTDPGYRVDSSDTGFTDFVEYETKRIDNPELDKGEEHIKQNGVRGRTIIVTRYVYNRAGELIRKADFKSVYAPEKEIIEVGTKEPAKTEGETEKKPAGDSG
ncbi:MAG: VanW family protein [Coriobacteriales bacterium]|nr:VanW family protein [Coriobacteriales bacterium]